jgi:hypothetical protein
MRTPSSKKRRLDLCPTFGRPVHPGFPRRLRPGTSPHALQENLDFLIIEDELLWNMPGWGVTDESMSHILNSPLTGKTYKLPPRTVGLINGLAHEYGTKGNVLAAIAHMLAPDQADSRPDLHTRLTRMPLPPPNKINYEKGETAEIALATDMQRLKGAAKRKGRK